MKNGRPRNPKCQGLIEQRNGVVEKLNSAHFQENKSDKYSPWSEWLPLQFICTIDFGLIGCFTIDQLNLTVHRTMKVSPYELVFGQPPCQNIFLGACTNKSHGRLRRHLGK